MIEEKSGRGSRKVDSKCPLYTVREVLMKKKKRNRQMTGKIVLGVLLLTALGGGIGVALSHAKGDTGTEEKRLLEGTVQQGDLELQVSAEGTTAGTTGYQLLGAELAARGLTVETVIAEEGETVKKGDSLYTLTDESVEEVEEALEQELAQYQSELTQAQLTYEEAVNEAKTEYRKNKSLADMAKLDYQDTLEELQQRVVEAKKELKENKTVLQNYPEEIQKAETELAEKKKQKTNLQKKKTEQEKAVQKLAEQWNTLKKEYQEAQAAYAEIKVVAQYLTRYQEEEPAVALEELRQTVKSQLAKKEAVCNKAESAYTELDKKYTSGKKRLESLSAKLTKVKQAITEQTEARERKKTELADAKKKQLSCQAQYLEAVSCQTSGSVTAKQDYEESVNTSRNAKTIYEAALQDAENDLQTAKDNLMAVKTQKKEFTSLVRKDTVVADRDGILAEISYQAGDTLGRNIPLAGYQDSSVMNIALSISQEDIASIRVGDTAQVMLSSVQGGLEGTVSSIGMASSSESVSTVTYPVIVTVENASGSITSDETAVVSFGKGTLENVLYVPLRAVETEQSKSYITVKQEDGTTKRTLIKTGEDNGESIVIEQGLKKGDTYVVEMES